MIVRQLVHVERIPSFLIPGFHVAGKDTVPEVDPMKSAIVCVIAPDDTHIQHIEMIVRPQMHTAVAVMMSIGNNHPVQVVLIFGFDQVFDTVVCCIECRLSLWCLSVAAR